MGHSFITCGSAKPVGDCYKARPKPDTLVDREPAPVEVQSCAKRPVGIISSRAGEA
jgi:hypothetical protein